MRAEWQALQENKVRRAARIPLAKSRDDRSA